MRRTVVPVKRNIKPAVRATQYGSLQIAPQSTARPEGQRRVGLTCFLFGAFFVPLAFFIFFASSPSRFPAPQKEEEEFFFVHSTLLSQSTKTEDYFPVLFLHGLESSKEDGIAMQKWLSHFRPNQKFTSLPLYQLKDSLSDLNDQVEGISNYIRKLHDDPDYSRGYHLIGHSQGGILLRCVLQAMPDHRARSLISLASPQLGVYGDGWLTVTKFPMIRLLYDVRTFHEFLYTTFMQSTPFGQFWHDPVPSHGFLQKNTFLPHWNGLLGEVPGHKENFLKVGKAFFFTGNISKSTYDGGIDPWNTAVWSFYDENYNFQPMEMQAEYKLDNFGLRSLDERGDLHNIILPDVAHDDWINNFRVFNEHILPLLD